MKAGLLNTGCLEVCAKKKLRGNTLQNIGRSPSKNWDALLMSLICEKVKLIPNLVSQDFKGYETKDKIDSLSLMFLASIPTAL